MKKLILYPRTASPLLFLLTLLVGCGFVHAQTAPDSPFRIGERLTYSVGFEKFSNVAYAEMQTVSRGKIGDVDAIELRSKVKTLNFVSAAFYLVDESRTIFVSPETGLPLYISRIENVGGLPRESIKNYLAAPTANFDLVTMIYKIRHSDAAGALFLQEGDKAYPLTFQTTVTEKVATDAGEFDTSVVTIQSDYLTENGMKDLRINFSTDSDRIPVEIRFKTTKGEFTAKISTVQNIEPPADPLPTPSPVRTPSPTPLPAATPRPYLDNQPLSDDLAFDLGETLEYRISSGGQPVATFALQAKERKQVEGKDSLLLTGRVTSVTPGSGVAAVNDGMKAFVDPDSLGPRKFDIEFTGPLSSLDQSAVFDDKTSMITFNGTNQVAAPVGTHNILSLIYAMRSFNLKPSKDTSNPVNDTRVAVFWENKPYIFTLRPSSAEMITLNGEKVSAQLISINTGNPRLDELGLKVWLSNDDRRLPLRFSVGRFIADLISVKSVPPK